MNSWSIKSEALFKVLSLSWLSVSGPGPIMSLPQVISALTLRPSIANMAKKTTVAKIAIKKIILYHSLKLFSASLTFVNKNR